MCVYLHMILIFSGKYEILQKQNIEAVRTIKEQKDLITQLENDVLNLNNLPSTFRGQGEGEAAATPHTEIVEKAVQGVLLEGTFLSFLYSILFLP